MANQRVQKVLSDQGICSRRAAEQWILQGRVKVNGNPVSLGDKMDPDCDELVVDERKISVLHRRNYRYLMLNKPRGYLSTVSDDRGRKTVMDLVNISGRRLYPIGRLDKDSEGLLLLTDDGAFANLLTSPRNGISKRYRVTVHPRANEEQLTRLASGVVLDDGIKTAPMVVRVVSEQSDDPRNHGRSVLEMTLYEGRNREIRRMCEAVGLTVVRLRRIAEGPVKLGMLAPGQWRELKREEVKALRNAAHPTARAQPRTSAPT